MKKSAFNSRDLVELLQGSILGLAVKVLAAIAVFVMSVVAARMLGAEQVGVFFLGITIITMISTIARLGLDNAIVRFVASSLAEGKPDRIAGLYYKAFMWSGCLSVVLALFLFLLSEFLVLYDPSRLELGETLKVLVVAMVFLGGFTLYAKALQGIRLVAQSLLVLSVIAPLVTLMIIYVYPVSSAKGLAWAYVGGCLSSFSIGFFLWRRAKPRGLKSSEFSSRILLSSCIPLWWVMILNQLGLWSAQLMLGFWASSSDVALFAASQRTAMLTSFVLVAVNAIAAPKFAAMYSSGDFDGLRRMVVYSMRMLLCAGVPALLFLLFFPEWILSFFGNEFRGASNVLMVLAVGQFVNIATGSVGYLLSMTGHERELRLNVLVSAVIGVGFGIILIPMYGIMGGAISTSLAVASKNLLGVYRVNNVLGFNTLKFWKDI
jgi:O-antigen/teichoic acid export membrane protein